MPLEAVGSWEVQPCWIGVELYAGASHRPKQLGKQAPEKEGVLMACPGVPWRACLFFRCKMFRCTKCCTYVIEIW